VLRYQVSQIYDLTVIFKTYAHDICLALPNWLIKLSWIFDISRFEPLGIAVIILAVGVEAKGRSYSVFSVRESKQQRWSNYFVYLQSTSTAWCMLLLLCSYASRLLCSWRISVTNNSSSCYCFGSNLHSLLLHLLGTSFEISNTWIVLVVILYNRKRLLFSILRAKITWIDRIIRLSVKFYLHMCTQAWIQLSPMCYYVFPLLLASINYLNR